VALVAGLAFAATASSESAASTGAFDEYASGPALGYSDISGRAQLIRTGDGRTTAAVEITGLHPSTEYAVHVHVLHCADLGGHYMFDAAVPDGDGPLANEIWPGPITTNAAGVGRGSTTVGASAASSAQSIVVHATSTGGDRIGCADLP
jgi:hypothetical protein